MAGYSSTPLAKKLGFKEGFRVGFVNPPQKFQQELGTLPADVKISLAPLTKPLDLILFFRCLSTDVKAGVPQTGAETGEEWNALDCLAEEGIRSSHGSFGEHRPGNRTGRKIG